VRKQKNSHGNEAGKFIGVGGSVAADSEQMECVTNTGQKPFSQYQKSHWPNGGGMLTE